MSMHTRSRNALLAFLAGALLPGIFAAQPAQAGSDPGNWQYSASVYAYLPTIGGTTTFPADSGGTGINVDVDQIIDNLEFVFMGSLEAHNGRWGVFSDIIYIGVDASESASRDFTIGGVLPAGTTADLHMDLNGWAWTLVGEYRVSTDPAATMDLLAGVRLFDLETQLDWDITGSIGSLDPARRTGSAEVGSTVVDGVIGVKGRYAFGADRKWSVPYYFDVGTGESDLTWQAAVGITYAFSWGGVSALWRYLDYDFGSGDYVQEMNFNGPMIGATFRW